MGVKELILSLAIFVFIFTLGASFVKMFDVNVKLPDVIEKNYANMTQQVKTLENEMKKLTNSTEARNIFEAFKEGTEKVAAFFGLIAAGGSIVFNTFFSFPLILIDTINYIASQLQVPPIVIGTFIFILTAYFVFKLIEFFLGKPLWTTQTLQTYIHFCMK